MENRTLIFLILTLILTCLAKTKAIPQSLNDLSLFPEDYNGQTIDFTNIYIWPMMFDIKHSGKNYYNILLNNYSEDFKFGSGDKITSVVNKALAKQVSSNLKTNSTRIYKSNVRGKVIKINDGFISEYFYLLSKIEVLDDYGKVYFIIE